MSATYPFYTGQVPTAEDFNQLAVRSELASSGGASMIGYGATTVAHILDSITAPSVTSVAGKTGAVTLSFADVSGVAAVNGDSTQNFNVKDATGSHHAISLGQADARYAPIGGGSGGGSVTSVGLSLPSGELTVAGSPVTGAGTLSATWASQAPHTVFAGPASGSVNGTPVFRAFNFTDVSGTLSLGAGGTGQTTAQAAIDALTGAAGAGNEYVFTRDTATGHAMFKPPVGGSSSFIASGTGAVTRTMQNKVRESVSILDFGENAGNGVVDAGAIAQLAVNAIAAAGGGALYFPGGGNYNFITQLVLPAADITLYGDGPSSRIFGSGNLVAYPGSPYGSTSVALQNIYDLQFEQTGNGTIITMHQTWDALGKPGPEIAGCFFYHSSLTTTAATSISLQGVWAADINNNYFIGRGAGGGPTTGIGGYGLRLTPGATSAGSVMNVVISNNSFITLAYPIYMDPRSGSGGSAGRIEGIKIIGNNMAAGYTAVTTNQTLATTITGCQLSDFFNGVLGTNDFDMSIVGNGEITGRSSGISLIAGGGGLVTDRITITGNNISGASGVGVRLTNASGPDESLRSVVVGSNSFRGVPGAAAGTGLSLEGSYAISGCAFLGNSFAWLTTGISFSAVAHTRNSMLGNTYSSVTTEVNNFSYSGTNGGQVTALAAIGSDSRFMIQAGADGSTSAPVITFPKPFKAGTTPVVFLQSIGTGNTTLEAPGISMLSNTTLEIQKKQLAGGSVILSNYTVGWIAFGAAP